MVCWISESEELILAHTYSKQSIARKLFSFEDRPFLTQAREGFEPYFRWLAIKTQTKNQTNPSFPNSNKKPTPEHSNWNQFYTIFSGRWNSGRVPSLTFSLKSSHGICRDSKTGALTLVEGLQLLAQRHKPTRNLVNSFNFSFLLLPSDSSQQLLWHPERHYRKHILVALQN